jgi:hypothetical protein
MIVTPHFDKKITELAAFQNLPHKRSRQIYKDCVLAGAA